jgi:alcohol dehydrogenase class IV
VTRNAVLAAPGHGVKVSMRSPLMLARLAVVDPELTLGLPPALTASTGMDALTQLIEPYLSVRANPLTDGYCVEGMRRVARSLRNAVRDGQDLAARTDMALASLLGGLSLANAGLGAVHGFASPIGGRFAAPHGAVCAALLPAVMRANLDALRARDPGSPALARFDTVARLLTGDEHARAEDGLAWLDGLRQALAIPRLSAYGISAAHADDLVEAASRASSMRGNCIALERDELRRVLDASL